jgi:hypothetical protein
VTDCYVAILPARPDVMSPGQRSINQCGLGSVSCGMLTLTEVPAGKKAAPLMLSASIPDPTTAMH